MPAPPIVVDETIETPPYRQLLEQLRAAVERGDLTPGTALPPVRQLAGDLGIAPNTVARAYAELQADGWLVADGRRGTRVAGRPPTTDGEARRRALHDAVSRFVDGLAHRGFAPEEIAAAWQRVEASPGLTGPRSL